MLELGGRKCRDIAVHRSGREGKQMAGHASQKKQDRSSWSFEFNKNTDLPANLMCSAGLCPQYFLVGRTPTRFDLCNVLDSIYQKCCLTQMVFPAPSIGAHEDF